jgi:lipopolysaccharide biosynthesis protein
VLRDVIIRILTLSQLPRLLRLSPDICEVWGDCQEIKTSLKCDSGSKIPSLVLFAHWEATSRLSDPDIHTISLLRQSGFQVIIVSTVISSTQGHDNFWETYAHLIDGLISRNNIGFDFGSWQEGLEVLNRKTITFDELILMNNSLYPITEDISTVIEKFKNKIDVGSLTCSNEFRTHFQSYFLYFSSLAIASIEFSQFWIIVKQFSNVSTGKRKVIAKLELTWGDYFSSNQSLEVGSAFDLPSHLLRNPMTFYWKELTELNFPFIKKSLFVQNYEEIDMSDWIDVVGERISNETLAKILKDIELRNFSYPTNKNTSEPNVQNVQDSS